MFGLGENMIERFNHKVVHLKYFNDGKTSLKNNVFIMEECPKPLSWPGYMFDFSQQLELNFNE